MKILFSIVLFQIIYGAFVAGLHAGKFANTFPTMDGEWIPSGIFSSENFLMNFFENPVTVQFIHRITAMIIVCMVAWLWLTSDKKAMTSVQKKGLHFLVAAIVIQFILGVLTLLSKAEITLASLHQVGAFILFSAVIFLLFQFRTERS